MVKTKEYLVHVLESCSAFSYSQTVSSAAEAVRLYYTMASMAVRNRYCDQEDFHGILHLCAGGERFSRKFNSFVISVTLWVGDVVREVGSDG